MLPNSKAPATNPQFWHDFEEEVLSNDLLQVVQKKLVELKTKTFSWGLNASF
jgi:hypothetical protein